MSQLPTAPLSTASATVIQAYTHACGRWHGCCWPTAFGSRRLNLDGISANQARVMADALAGSEADEWRQASRWLLTIEQDAQEAEKLAAEALRLWSQGRHAEARNLARRILAVESAHHPNSQWTPFVEALGT